MLEVVCHGDSPARGGGQSHAPAPVLRKLIIVLAIMKKKKVPLSTCSQNQNVWCTRIGVGVGAARRGDVDPHPCTPLCSPVTVELSECRSCWQCQGWTWPSTLHTCDASLVAVTTRVQVVTSLSLISSNGPRHSCHSLICLPPSSGSALSRSILTHSFSLSHPHA